jgi:hypothetical protein
MAIVTNKFRVVAASSFASRFSTDNIYLVLGRPQSWADSSYSTIFSSQASGTPADNNPPNPFDNYENESAFWRDAMAGTRLAASDVKLATVRNNWQYGVRFDMYRHNINAANPTINGNFNLADSNMIVYVTSTGAVYKCLFNGKSALNPTGNVSTVAPSTTNAAPEGPLADGYIWKYLYTVSAADADFVTASYIPVPTTQSIATSNGIHVILVSAAGTGYNSSNTTLTIYGDGTGCAATAVISGSSLSTVSVTNAGTGYTWAKVVVSGTGSGAGAYAAISPAGGHASNLQHECSAFNVMIAGTVSGYQSNDIPVNQDFRIVGMVRNPYIYSADGITSTGTVLSSNTARVSRTLNVTSTVAVTPDILLTGGSSQAIAYAVFQSSGTTQIQYIQPVPSDVPDNILSTVINTSTGKLRQFVNGEVISGTGYNQTLNSSNGITAVYPEMQPYSGELIYLDYRQPVTRSAGQNEKINIVINF